MTKDEVYDLLETWDKTNEYGCGSTYDDAMYKEAAAKLKAESPDLYAQRDEENERGDDDEDGPGNRRFFEILDDVQELRRRECFEEAFRILQAAGLRVS